MIRRSGGPCRNSGVEVRRAYCSRYWWTSLVHAREELTIVSRGLLVLSLNLQWSLVMLTLGNELSRGRPRRNSSVTAVVADAIDSCVVHDDRLVVDIGHVGDVHIGHAAVVVEVTSAPLATVVAVAGIPEAVVDAAVEANVRPPIAAMEDVEPFVPSPPAGSPEHSHGGDYPGARHPVVAVIIVPRPITRRPQIAGSGTDGLRINRQGGRPDSYRDSHCNLTK
jgi:hypothetical protein